MRRALCVALFHLAGVLTAHAQSLVISGATVIDGTDGPPRQASVVVEDGAITCVGSPTDCPPPPDARTIDARGRWLIPGLFDAHAHLTEERGDFGPLYLAFGVTSVRDVGGYVDSLLALRSRIDAGSALGPRIYLAGRPIDGHPTEWPVLYGDVPVVVRTAEEAARAVRDAKASGSDFIKLYHGLNPSLMAAAVAEAHRLGLKATVDLMPWRFPPDSAVAAGVDGYEHAIPPPGGDIDAWKNDSAGMAALVARVVASGAALTTTMVLHERSIPTLPTDEPTFQALSEALRNRSAEMVRASRSGRSLDYACRTARAVVANGGIVLAGTDSYYMVSYPGDLLREIELLVECGLTTEQALAAGTRNPASWLRADSLGTIEAGKVADLVLLRGDPLADIRQIREIEWVMARGRLVGPSEAPAVLPQQDPRDDAVAASPERFTILLENDHVRVVQYTLGPGERDTWHTHPPKVSYVARGGSLRIHLEDGTSFLSEEKEGTAVWMDALPRHYAENVGDTPVQIILIEVKPPKP